MMSDEKRQPSVSGKGSAGFDCTVTLHINEAAHGAALKAARAARDALNDLGYLVTLGPCLPHVPLSCPEDVARIMENDE